MFLLSSYMSENFDSSAMEMIKMTQTHFTTLYPDADSSQIDLATDVYLKTYGEGKNLL